MLREEGRSGRTSVEVIAPWHGAGADDRTGKPRELGGCKVQLTADVPVDIDVGDVGQVAMETMNPLG